MTARLSVALLLVVLTLPGTASAVEYVGGRWTDDRGNVWLTDREVWWHPERGLYYVDGYWRDGAGRYWDAATNVWRKVQSYGANPIIDVVSGHRSGVEQWRDLVASVFPAWAVDDVLRVMACESNGDPWATGAAGERGLLQIHPRYHADATYDPEGNLRAAYRISNGGQSWAAWTCKP